MVWLDGSGFPPDTLATVSYEGTTIWQTRTNAGGRFNGTWTMPADAQPGERRFVASAGGTQAETYFTVWEPRIILTPTSGPVGTRVTVTGQFFPSSRTVTVMFEGTPISPSAATTAAGEFAVTIVVPSTSVGRKRISASTGSLRSQDLYFEVQPGMMTINPASGPVGTRVTVKGWGFNLNQRMSILCDGKEWISATTSRGDGTIDYLFSVPPTPAGPHEIVAVDVLGNRSRPSQFIVDPSMKIDAPDQLQISTTKILVSGAGFSANSSITVTLDGAGKDWQVRSNTAGSFELGSTVDEAAGGQWRIRATDSSKYTLTSDKSYRITPKISLLGDSSGAVGSKAMVQGRGFRPGEKGIGIFIGSVSTGISAESNARGSFECTATVPPVASGTWELTARDSLGTRIIAESKFTIQAGLNLDSNEGHVNKRVGISGTGYKANADIGLLWDNAAVSLETSVRTDGNGSFTGSLLVPRCKNGPHNLVVTDATNRVSATWVVESIPPMSPAPLSPRSGNRIGHIGSQTPTFKWTIVPDPSGTYYHLSIARDESFGTTVLNKEFLTGATYIPERNEALGRGGYYWRVKAVDGAYNESAWSNSSVLRIGSDLIFWLLAAIISAIGCAGIFYRLSVGFTPSQRTAIAQAKTARNAERQAQREKISADRERLEQMKQDILKLAQESRGAVEVNSVTARSGIDSKTARWCLRELGARQEGDWYYFEDIEKKYRK